MPIQAPPPPQPSPSPSSTAPAILMPDVELAVTAYLRRSLDSYGYGTDNTRVSTSYKGDSPCEVWVRSDGGPLLDKIRSVTRIGINCFAAGPTDVNVSELSRTVSALLRAMPDGQPVIHVVETSVPHPVLDSTPRRYATYEIWTRGAPL